MLFPAAVRPVAAVFGGFGFTRRQLAKHELLYAEHGFEVLPVLSTIPQLITPSVGWERGPRLAAQLQAVDAPCSLHLVSGSFWTGIFTLAHLDPGWRSENVKAVVFDSCPPKSDVYAFGGWLSWMVEAKTGLDCRVAKPLLSQLFHPVRLAAGINAQWTAQNDKWCFGSGAAPGDACVVPRSAACLFVRGRNDPVLEPEYVDAWCAFLRARTTATVESRLFESQHAMAVVEHPKQYRDEIERLLRRVPEWAPSVIN